MNKQGTKLLAAAIINRAVQDWKDAEAVLEKYPDDANALEMMYDCELFFRSQWYQTLRDITPEIPEDMMRRLNG
ncbi:MAG: hypothetical protein J5744_08960 [Oscillospiraceae bacterium]|nr:hypothetical protein [Oscillospiraceae bacterium]